MVEIPAPRIPNHLVRRLLDYLWLYANEGITNLSNPVPGIDLWDAATLEQREKAYRYLFVDNPPAFDPKTPDGFAGYLWQAVRPEIISCGPVSIFAGLEQILRDEPMN